MLSHIVYRKKQRVGAAASRLPLGELKKRLVETHQLVRSFSEALRQPGMSLIAEVKKASPSKGSFGLQVPVSELAKQYELGGARAISVLTEEDYFLGHADDLHAVRNAVTLPVLRKDFIIDSYQIYESRYLCADAILLIARLLTLKQLREFLSLSSELGMDALVEAHNAAELEMSLEAGATLIGINNRDLKTFRTNVNHTISLANLVPDEVILVSESGIQTAEEVEMLAAAAVDAILVGETLVTSESPAVKIRELTGGKQDDKN
jgi:indole-3-glycerol phosphate synthase